MYDATTILFMVGEIRNLLQIELGGEKPISKIVSCVSVGLEEIQT